jgi:fibronectin-binding autotransporter adhesin
VSSGTVGIKGSTQLGNPTNTLNVLSNAAVVLYENTDLGTNVAINKTILLHDGATFQNGQGANIEFAPVILSTNASGGTGLCTINVGGTSLAFSNAITGPGTLIKTGGSPLILGAGNTYTGLTILSAGAVDLVGTGSISTTPYIVLLSGATLDVSGRSDGTLTLASGQTLEGSGTVNGDLTVNSGATVEAGTNDVIGTLTVTNVATLHGTTTMALSAPTSSSELKAATVNYGGTLNLVFTAGSLSAGDSFQLFNATAGYSGTFANISPATPGPGLQWNTSELATSGTLLVAAATASSPVINSVHVLNGNLVFSGTNGTPSGSYVLQVATNLTLAPNPVEWQSVSTNSFDTNGDFTLSIATTLPAQYFRIKLLP